MAKSEYPTRNLRPWDGIVEGFPYRYSQSEITFWGMMVDDNGTIYYTQQDTGEIMIWCAASRLLGHMRHLNALIPNHFEQEK